MEEGRIKRALSKLNEVLGFESPEPVGLITTKEIDPYFSVVEKTKAAIEQNPKISDNGGERWLTTTQVSAMVNLPRKTILNHIHKGQLKGQSMGRTFVVEYNNIVDAYGQEFIERGLNTSIKPKFFIDRRRNSNHAGTQVLKAGYMTKDRVIQELNDRVRSLTSEVVRLDNRVSELASQNDDLCERNRSLINDTYHKLNKDI